MLRGIHERNGLVNQFHSGLLFLSHGAAKAHKIGAVEHVESRGSRSIVFGHS